MHTHFLSYKRACVHTLSPVAQILYVYAGVGFLNGPVPLVERHFQTLPGGQASTYHTRARASTYHHTHAPTRACDLLETLDGCSAPAPTNVSLSCPPIITRSPTTHPPTVPQSPLPLHPKHSHSGGQLVRTIVYQHGWFAATKNTRARACAHTYVHGSFTATKANL